MVTQSGPILCRLNTQNSLTKIHPKTKTCYCELLHFSRKNDSETKLGDLKPFKLLKLRKINFSNQDIRPLLSTIILPV